MIRIVLLILTISLTNLFSQEYKFFGLEETMKFERFTYKYISDNGDWLIYGLSPDRGDGKAIIQSTRNETKYEIPRAERPKMSETANFIAFKVEPDFLQKENEKKDNLADTLFILNTSNGNIIKHSDIVSYDISNDGNWLYYNLKEESKKENGKTFYLKHLESNSDIVINDVENINFDSTSSYLIYSKRSSDNLSNGLYFRDLKKSFAPEITIQKDTNYLFDDFLYNIDFNKLVYMVAQLDSNKKAYQYELNLYDFEQAKYETITKKDEFKDWYIPKKNRLKWTQNGERLFYGVKPLSQYIPEEDEKDKDKLKKEELYDINKILKDAGLYIWHHDDNKIITQKRTEWNKEKDKTYDAIFHLNAKLNVKLGDTTLPEVEYTENKVYTIGYDPTPYEKRITYDGWYFDLYFIDLFSGERVLVEKELYSNAYLSDNKPYIMYFKDLHWHFYDITQRISSNVTSKLSSTNFYDELHDEPSKPRSYGAAGWSSFNDDETFIIYDRYDFWEVRLPVMNLLKVNQGAGRSSNKIYRIVKLEHNQTYVNLDDAYFSVFNYEDKSSELLHTMKNMEFFELKDSVYWSYELKAKYSDDIVVSRKSYNIFPDLYLTNPKFENPKKLTNIHPEIPEYNWGYTEMVKYTNSKGDTLQGFVIKPNNFDPNKKYPLLVYFYERFSQLRHQFTSPTILHRPIYPWYISQGYCMFFPDIKFYEGRPGDSGLDAVVSGCQKLVDDGFIDKEKIAIHGHSWSGYQSAYFVTQTDFFKACVTGAPVSNMTSAYSGIRLGSGLARQFQYEKMQSRIGGDLIDSLDAYIANSPIFFADKINTPMLIMFGDIDDAVPWQQGIELYLACRRYGKECIMLQYENEPHHLKKYSNKMDYTIKMKQFFDHYILGKEAADWIKSSPNYKGKPHTMELKK